MKFIKDYINRKIDERVKEEFNKHYTIDIPFYHPEGIAPYRGSTEAAGYDVRAYLPHLGEHGILEILPNQVASVMIGIHMSVPEGHAIFVMSRSGFSGPGVLCTHGVGLGDSDYTGMYSFPFINLTNEVVKIQHGDRVGQLVFMKHCVANFIPCPQESLKETERGSGKHGSTGKK